jgi:hypothetical protein
MTNIWNHITEKLNRRTNRKNFCYNNNCPYYEINNEKYNDGDNRQEDIKTSIEKLIKENEKYFTYEIERTTFDCITNDNSRIKTLGYSNRVAYEIFEKHGIFMYVSDLGTYINSPKHVSHELQRLICIYGIEKVTEEIATYLKEKYPQRFGVSLTCKQ